MPEALLFRAARLKFPGYPEVHGRVASTKGGKAGRFGWKAQVPNLEEFVLSACAGELGLQVPGHSQAADPAAPDAKPPGLDMDAGECDRPGRLRGRPARAGRPAPDDLV